ncbi:MAG: deoxyuridine 5'-triphosphate nucleotidohydrolase [Acidilobaceae archaeon]|nr:deoxyuridine 5'-triphosphate nucleotidohydrolase [Acidilobaceae archaeon]MDW7973917.1 deoxyuridine 5'-triphosphate nucleotidohydrolase [Sulfolobales archaeon]
MALPGQLARGFVYPLSESSVQPAGVDLRLCEVEEIEGEGYLGEERRERPAGKRVELAEGVWRLSPGAYRVRYCEAVKVPEDAVGLIFPRSSLLRMGAVLHGAVWDPGYNGRGEGLLVAHKRIALEKGVRIAQIVFFKLIERAEKLYSGAYQGENLWRKPFEA